MHTNTLKDQTARALLAIVTDMANGMKVDKQVLALAKNYGVELAN